MGIEPKKIGHIIIDHHHEEVFSLDRLLDDSFATGKIDSILKAIVFLKDYSEDHFAEEEALMLSSNSDQLPQHQKEHSALKEAILELWDYSKTNPPYAHLALKTRRIVDRLIRHINHTDSKLQELL